MARPTTILIVDDEEHILDILGSVLEDEGYAVLKACNGAEGLRLAQEHRPALIITDAMMPLLNGIELIRLLKESEATASTPTILMSCVSRNPTSSGASYFLGKPFDLDVVLALVKGYASTGTREDAAAVVAPPPAWPVARIEQHLASEGR